MPCPVLVLKTFETDGRCACALCGAEFTATAELGLCVEGSYARVCEHCTFKHADPRLQMAAAMAKLALGIANADESLLLRRTAGDTQQDG